MKYAISIIQTILHYLGWIGIILGAIALIFGNFDRGKDLVVGGISFIVLKYFIGIIYMGIIALITKGRFEK